MTETTPTDIVRVVRDGECKLDNHSVDTSIANLGVDDTDQYLVVQSSIGAETQPAPIFFETFAALPQPTPAFLQRVDLDYMRKSWSSLAVVSALTPRPDDSVFDKIPDSERRPPYFTDEGGVVFMPQKDFTSRPSILANNMRNGSHVMRMKN